MTATDLNRGTAIDDLHHVANQVLASQPFSQLLGATLSSVGPGGAEIRLPITHEIAQQQGAVISVPRPTDQAAPSAWRPASPGDSQIR